MNDEMLRLKAVLMVQTADVSAILGVLQIIETTVRPDYPAFPDLTGEFLKRRKEVLHFLLEDYESTNPAFAAKI